MTDFTYWGGQLAKSGLVLCCLCLEAKPFEDMNVTEDGDVEDVCVPCADIEMRELLERAIRNEQ